MMAGHSGERPPLTPRRALVLRTEPLTVSAIRRRSLTLKTRELAW